MNKFDVVIIGSGMGGLCAATILSKNGLKVCVLEKNRQFGGNLQTYSRNKQILDTGVHYVGGLDEGQNLHRIFSYLGIQEKLKLRRMNESGFDVISFEGDPEHYRYAIGHDNFINTLAEYFPNDRAAIKKYCRDISEICLKFPLYNLKKLEFNYMNNANIRDYERFLCMLLGFEVV